MNNEIYYYYYYTIINNNIKYKYENFVKYNVL